MMWEAETTQNLSPHWHFCTLGGKKKELIGATNHKGEHVLTSRTLLNQDFFLIPIGDKAVY